MLVANRIGYTQSAGEVIRSGWPMAVDAEHGQGEGSVLRSLVKTGAGVAAEKALVAMRGLGACVPCSIQPASPGSQLERAADAGAAARLAFRPTGMAIVNAAKNPSLPAATNSAAIAQRCSPMAGVRGLAGPSQVPLLTAARMVERQDLDRYRGGPGADAALFAMQRAAWRSQWGTF